MSYYDNPAAGQQDSVPRRLPPVPRSARPTSRPLPQVPRALACKQCRTCITSSKVLLPPTAVSIPSQFSTRQLTSVQFPSDSRSFKGFSGKASLFTETYAVHAHVHRLLSQFPSFPRYNVKLSRPGVQLMATGAHTMQEITCSSCSVYLGWKILRAHERSEKWKEGTSLLELENLFHDTDVFAPLYIHPRGNGSDSDVSS